VIEVLEVLIDGRTPSKGHIVVADIFEATALARNELPIHISVRPTARISTRAPIFTYQVQNVPISTNNVMSYLAYRAKVVRVCIGRRIETLEIVRPTMRDLELALLERIAILADPKWLKRASAETDVYRNTKAVRLQTLYCIEHRMRKQGNRPDRWGALSAAILDDEDWQLRNSQFDFLLAE
jgi:hypothetical protein